MAKAAIIGAAKYPRNERYVRRWKAGKEYGRREHILLVEKALGKAMPVGAVVHHVDGDSKNNAPSNLVVCQNEAYHSLLHRRTRALQESGNANYLKCVYCGKWDDPRNLYLRVGKGSTNPAARHRECHNAVTLAAYHKRRKQQ